MRSLLENNDAINFQLLSGKLKPLTIALAGNHTIDPDGPIGHFLNPGATPRDVTLPLVDEGLFYFILNQGTASLTVKNASGTTIATLPGGVGSIFYTDRQGWFSLIPSTAYTVFGPAGAGHSIGLVPDPGPVGSGRFLREDGTWASASGSGVTNAYSFITDGTNTANGTGADTFKLRSSSGKISIVVTDNDGVHGDNANLSVVEANVDHNSLLNFVANKHIDHSGVSITGSSGISGGGDITVSRSLSLDINGLGIVAPASGDFIPFWDISGTVNGKMTIASLTGVIDHDSLLNWVANKHIDHTSVSITAGAGLTGGGTIAASRTISLDVNGLGVATIVSGDFVPFYDISAVGHAKTTFANFNAALDHNVLVNFVANKHIDHSAVTITGTGALTGGGDITASRTIDVAAGGITLAKMANIATDSLIGRDTAGSGAPENILLNATLEMDGSLNLRRAALTGDVTASAGSNATTIANAAVTFAKMANIGTDSLIGRDTAGSGAPEAITLTNGLEFDGSQHIQMTSNQRIIGIPYVIDGGGSVITTGLKYGIYIPFACTITAWTIGLDQSGSIVIDIWKDVQANYPPTIADTITAAAKPTVSSAQTATSSTLTGWTTSIAAATWLFFNVDSISTATWAEIVLTANKT